MTAMGVGASLTGAIAVLAAILAGATIWLLLTDPVMVAGAMNSGDAAEVTQALAEAIGAAVRALVRWL
jgi:hypothetical protein